MSTPATARTSTTTTTTSSSSKAPKLDDKTNKLLLLRQAILASTSTSPLTAGTNQPNTAYSSSTREAIRHAVQTFPFYTDHPLWSIAFTRQVIENKGPGGFRVDYPSSDMIPSIPWHQMMQNPVWMTMKKLLKGPRHYGFTQIQSIPKPKPEKEQKQQKDDIDMVLGQEEEKDSDDDSDDDRETTQHEEFIYEEEDYDSEEDDDGKDEKDEKEKKKPSTAKQPRPKLPLSTKQLEVMESVSSQIYQGKFFILITVPSAPLEVGGKPTGILMDFIVRERGAMDDFGILPAMIRDIYKCAQCGSNNHLGEKTATPMRCCPFCQAMFFCNEQHFNTSIQAHTTPGIADESMACGTQEAVLKRVKARFETTYDQKQAAEFFIKKHPKLNTTETHKRLKDYYELEMEKIDKMKSKEGKQSKESKGKDKDDSASEFHSKSGTDELDFGFKLDDVDTSEEELKQLEEQLQQEMDKFSKKPPKKRGRPRGSKNKKHNKAKSKSAVKNIPSDKTGSVEKKDKDTPDDESMKMDDL